MSREAMKQALGALEEINQLSIGENAIALPGEIDAAMDNLRAAIEHYDQTALELCKECGWKAIIPGDGCLVCARQKATPVAYVDERIHGWPDCFVMEPDPPHTVPLYTAPPVTTQKPTLWYHPLSGRVRFEATPNWIPLYK